MTIDTLPKLYLNGNGHTIKNFTGENSLFGSLANSTIKNLNIENCDITGDLHVGVLAENATDSEFIDINVKNCTIHAAKSRYAAFFVGVSRSSTFTDCNIENSKIVGDKVSLFFNNTDYPSQVINCKAKDYTMIAYTFVDDNMGFNCAYQTECGIGAVEMVVTDDDCTIDNIAGEFKSVKQNGVEITPVDSKYYIDKTDGCVILDVAFFDETLEFELEVDFESRTTKISGYYGTDKDIVIPEKIIGLEVVGLDEVFNTYLMDAQDVNSITVPGVIKSIPDRYFTRMTGLKKIILNDGVEEIGDYALGYVETEEGFAPIDGFTIYGFSGTAAETYANANGFNFVDLSACAQ